MKPITRYDHKRRVRPVRSFVVKKDSDGRVLNPDVVSMTRQSEREQADINTIVARAKKTGFLTTGFQGNRKPTFGDFSSGEDFLDAQRKVADFNSQFEHLPSDIRNQFDNRPELLLDFVADPENKEKCIELGLLPKPKITRKRVAGDIVTFKDGEEVARVPADPDPDAGKSEKGSSVPSGPDAGSGSSPGSSGEPAK